MCAQLIKNAPALGRLGESLGRGLAEVIPKEAERYRLSQGLKKLGEQKNLTPFQQFAELSSIPGATPQMIHSGSELLRQQAISNELRNKSKEEQVPKQNPFPKPSAQKQAGISPSITTREPIEATLKNYIPKTFEDIQQRAGELLDQNPALYGNDPTKALAAAQAEESQNSAINQAYQQRRQNEQNVQNNITSSLKSQQGRLNALEVPGNVYTDVETKAINAVRPIEEGGEGLTEQQAKIKYGKELDAINRDYTALDTIGSFDYALRNPQEIKRTMKSVREKFKERGDLENLADTYVSKNKLSPSKAYYLAYPSSEIKDLNNFIGKLPELKNEASYKKGFPEIDTNIPKEKTLNFAPKLAKLMGKEGSPLSIAEELNSRGYDPDVWLDYVGKNRKELDLTERQGRELDKVRNWFPTLNDNWLFLMSGLEKLVEK